MNPIEAIKSHPYLAGGIALVAVLGIVLLSSGGSSGGSVAGFDPSTVAAATQVANAQAAGASANYQTDAALKAKMSDNATALSIAQIQADATYNANSLTATVQQQATNAALTLGLGQLDVQKTQSTLDSSVRMSEIAAGTRANELSAQTAQQANASAASIVAQTLAAQTAAFNAQTAANVEINRPRSWLESIFG